MSAPVIGRRPKWVPPPTARVDWSHPLAQGLICCIIPGSSRTDLVTGITATQTGTVVHGTSRWGVGAQGVTASTPTNFLNYGTAGSLNGFTNGTITWVGKVVTAGVTVLLSKWPSSGFLVLTNAGTFRGQVNAGGVPTTAIGPSVASGTEAVVTTVKNGTSLRCWANGEGGTVASCNAGAFGAGADLRMFNKSDDSGTSGESVINAGFIHNRALSDGEVEMLHADPFCFLTY